MVSSWRYRLFHYSVLGTTCTLIAYQFTVCVDRLLAKALDIRTFVCISFLVIHVAPLCGALGIICRPLETAHLLNSWSQILSCLRTVGGGERKKGGNKFKYSSLSVCFKVIAMTVLVALVAFSAAVWSIVFSDLPIFLAPMLAKTLGMVPGAKVLPGILWPLLFFPVEFAAAGLPLAATGLAVIVVYLSIETFRIYLKELK